MASSIRSVLAVALCAALAAGAPALGPSPAAAEEGFTLTIKDHRFDPEVLEVPAGKKVKLVIRNQDDTPEEFESFDLSREKVIPGGAEAVMFVGPLEPGTYEFFGEFNIETAKGKVVAK